MIRDMRLCDFVGHCYLSMLYPEIKEKSFLMVVKRDTAKHIVNLIVKEMKDALD